MYNSNICELLSEAKRVLNISVTDSTRNEETGEWVKTVIMGIAVYKNRVFATRNGGKGNLILLSADHYLMDDLYHLCHLINYDVNYEELGEFRALELIGANGGSMITTVGLRSLFIHVDGKNPDHYFDKIQTTL